jgi:molybdate transport repressor ModE-like protein
MLKISINPHWALEANGEAAQPLSRTLTLLAAIKEEGNLFRGARRIGMSYRHAWGTIREAGRVFGAPLLEMSRGRGAVLTPLGEKLLWADRRVWARLAPILDSLASELEAEIERAVSDVPVLRIHASHGFAIELLRDILVTKNVSVDLKYRASMEALASFAGSDCDIAGFHVPEGDFQRAVLQFYFKWLQPERHTLINLATRRQGLMVAHGNSGKIVSLADLTRPGVRFVNRQFGSGTRILLDLLLKRAGIDSRGICGYDTGEFTHSAVAAYIASGLADAGFGVETAARRFKLEFIPVATERYFLICDDDSLTSPLVTRILEILTSGAFRAAAGKLAGVDVTYSGTVMRVHDAFPELTKRDKASRATPHMRKRPAPQR